MQPPVPVGSISVPTPIGERFKTKGRAEPVKHHHKFYPVALLYITSITVALTNVSKSWREEVQPDSQESTPIQTSPRV